MNKKYIRWATIVLLLFSHNHAVYAESQGGNRTYTKATEHEIDLDGAIRQALKIQREFQENIDKVAAYSTEAVRAEERGDYEAACRYWLLFAKEAAGTPLAAHAMYRIGSYKKYGVFDIVGEMVRYFINNDDEEKLIELSTNIVRRLRTEKDSMREGSAYLKSAADHSNVRAMSTLIYGAVMLGDQATVQKYLSQVLNGNDGESILFVCFAHSMAGELSENMAREWLQRVIKLGGDAGKYAKSLLEDDN